MALYLFVCCVQVWEYLAELCLKTVKSSWTLWELELKQWLEYKLRKQRCKDKKGYVPTLTIFYSRMHLILWQRSYTARQKLDITVQSGIRTDYINFQNNLWHTIQRLWIPQVFFLGEVLHLAFLGRGVLRMERDSVIHSTISSAASAWFRQNSMASAMSPLRGVKPRSVSSSLSRSLQRK